MTRSSLKPDDRVTRARRRTPPARCRLLPHDALARERAGSAAWDAAGPAGCPARRRGSRPEWSHGTPGVGGCASIPAMLSEGAPGGLWRVAGECRPTGHYRVTVSTSPTRVFAARLAGLPVFDPAGDQVGKVRDVVVVLRPRRPAAPGARPGRRGLRAPPDLRADDAGDQHRHRPGDHHRRWSTCAASSSAPPRRWCSAQMLDRQVTHPRAPASTGTVYDVAMEQARTRDWVICGSPSQERSKRFGRKGQTHVVEWDEVDGLHDRQDNQGADAPARGARGDAARRPRQRDPRPARQAPRRDRRRARRRAARRRPRGAARGGPGRDPRAPRQRARRRRPRGDVPRRRRRPDRRAAARDRRAAAPADGARRGRGRPPAAVLRGAAPPAA